MKFKVNYYYIVNKKGERKMSVNIETQDYIKQKEIQRQRQNQNNNNEQDNKISISTSNTSNNTMNNVLFSTTAEVPFQEVIKPLPTNDAMLISSKTIGEDKNITGFNNQNKILLF